MLTISIPTYNRSKELSQLLEMVERQLRGFNVDEVEVVVSDNCSSDDTESIVESWTRKFPEGMLRYFKNQQNVGFSRNVDLAVQRGRGDHVLIVGDDDGLEPDTIETLLRLVQAHSDAAVILLDTVPYDPQMNHPLENWLECDGLEIYENGMDYIRAKRGFTPALVSGYVVRREDWMSVPTKDYHETISIHMLVATLLLLFRRKIVVSRRKSIKYRTDSPNGTWSKDPLYPFRFHLDSLFACQKYALIAPPDVMRILKRIPLRAIIFLILQLKAKRRPFSAQSFDEYYGRVKVGCNVYSLLIWICWRVPRWMACCLYQMTGMS